MPLKHRLPGLPGVSDYAVRGPGLYPALYSLKQTILNKSRTIVEGYFDFGGERMAAKKDNKQQGSGGDQGGRSSGSSKKAEGRKSSGKQKSK
jgi:hypothetical protein